MDTQQRVSDIYSLMLIIITLFVAAFLNWNIFRWYLININEEKALLLKSLIILMDGRSRMEINMALICFRSHHQNILVPIWTDSPKKFKFANPYYLEKLRVYTPEWPSFCPA